MKTISDKYRDMNAYIHANFPGWGCGGSRWTKNVLSLSNVYGESVLDYGCGKATLRDSLPFEIQCYDPGIPEFQERPQPASVVVCTDVLEHIEPEYLDSVLQDLYRLTQDVVFLNVSTRAAHRRLPDGRNAHLIVKPYDWWLGKLNPYFKITHIVMKSGTEFAVVGIPKGMTK